MGTIVFGVALLDGRNDIQHQVTDLEEAAFELIAMTRALIDAAAARGRIDPVALEGRVTRAALGYPTGRANVGR